ncbi:hypothetical protein ACYSNR_11225 [Enterococcus sp. LJL128]|uniref:hypothetical protein n=1 Tax=Enterococcus sp. LJL51 TaxID=3416656 RepID=UPI003CF61EE2
MWLFKLQLGCSNDVYKEDANYQLYAYQNKKSDKVYVKAVARAAGENLLKTKVESW